MIGTGLIGASVGLALRELEWTVTGWDHSAEALQIAGEKGAFDRPAGSVAEATDEVELVVLAGPLSANIEILASLETDALITDVTSVKRPIIQAAPPSSRFVGGHPMAGREHAGPGASSPALFRGAPWVLCDDVASEDDVLELKDLVASMGANPIVMGAALHDRAVAEISHLPHVLAVLLTRIASRDPATSSLVAGSFRDLTRVAAADTGWWPEVLSANADEVRKAGDALARDLALLTKQIEEGSLPEVRHAFDSAREERSSMAPTMARVRVILQDQPGEIARVGHALEASHVDVRDIHLRHAEHGGGGVLTITVRPGEAEPLRAALQAESFEVE